MHGVRDIALFSCKLYALYFGATLQAQVTTATIGQFPRQTNAVTPGVAAFAFQQFFAVYRVYATTRKSSGEMIRKLSVIRSRKRPHFLGTVRLRKRRIADLNCAKVS